MENKNCYIFVSCKDWHKKSFESIIKKSNEKWFYASAPAELEEVLSKENPRYIFFIHWNWKVPEYIWRKYESVCFHMTDVPYGRGGSPLQNLILQGKDKTMLTALRMVEELDAGPVYIKKTLSLNGAANEIYSCAVKLSIEIIRWMIDVNPQPIPQEGELILFKRRKPEQSCLPTSGDLEKVYDFIRMLDAEGYPNAFIDHGSYRMYFRKARLDSVGVVAEVEIKKKPTKDNK